MPPVVTAVLAFCLLTGPLSQEGGASFYGNEFHGRRTASGERFSQQAYTAASRTLPFGTWVLVTRLDTGDTVIVRINDRGPFVRGRIIDLSRRAAEEIRMVSRGVARVRVDVIPAPADELPSLLAAVRQLIGDLPAQGETVALAHAVLPVGTEGFLDLLPDQAGVGETVTMPFRVVARIRRTPADAESALGGRARRAIRLRALPPPIFPDVESPLPVMEPVVVSTGAFTGNGEPLFPTPDLPAAPGSPPASISYPAN